MPINNIRQQNKSTGVAWKGQATDWVNMEITRQRGIDKTLRVEYIQSRLTIPCCREITLKLQDGFWYAYRVDPPHQYQVVGKKTKHMYPVWLLFGQAI